MTTEQFKVDKGISDIVGALTDPIIVYPGGWGDDLPEWLKTAITLDRMAMNMKVLKGELPTGTDSEACAYLYSASLTFPLDHDWAQIYLYVSTKVMESKRGKGPEVTMPADIRVDHLEPDQEKPRSK